MEENLIATEHICSDCGEELALTDEVFLVQVLYQSITPEGGEVFYNVEEGGDFVYTPHFFCMECWEETRETLEGLVEDLPPVGKPGATRSCAICKSGIENMEITAVITLGELRRSQRMPAGKPTIHFAGVQKPEVWCRACAARLSGDVIELWEEGFDDDERDEVMYRQQQEADGQYG